VVVLDVESHIATVDGESSMANTTSVQVTELRLRGQLAKPAATHVE